MNKNLKNIWLASMLIWGGLCACENEDALQPNPVGEGIAFAFPEGDQPWDRDLEEIAEQFGTKCIYKNLTLTDLTRTWLAPSVSTTVYIGGGLIDDRQARLYTQFFKEHVFRFLNPEVARGIFPNYIYFTYDFCSENIYPAIVFYTAQTFKFDGMGFWSFCFETEEHTNAVGQSWQNHMFTTPTEIMQNRDVILRNIFKLLVDKGMIVPPAAFAVGGGLDYTTPVVYGATKVNDENYFKRRGFPERFTNLKNYGKPADLTSIKNTGPILTFIDYLNLAFRYAGDAIRENYKDFPLVIQYYELTVEYMKNTYGMDISLIAEMPENGLEE